MMILLPAAMSGRRKPKCPSPSTRLCLASMLFCVLFVRLRTARPARPEAAVSPLSFPVRSPVFSVRCLPCCSFRVASLELLSDALSASGCMYIKKLTFRVRTWHEKSTFRVRAWHEKEAFHAMRESDPVRNRDACARGRGAFGMRPSRVGASVFVWKSIPSPETSACFSGLEYNGRIRQDRVPARHGHGAARGAARSSSGKECRNGRHHRSGLHLEERGDVAVGGADDATSCPIRSTTARACSRASAATRTPKRRKATCSAARPHGAPAPQLQDSAHRPAVFG